MVRKGGLLTNVQIGFELEQRSGPGQQQIEIGRVSDVAQSADFVGPCEDLPLRRPAAVCMMTGINFVTGLALMRWANS